MLRKTATLPDFPDFHTFWGFDPEDSLFFDIETTGLSAASSHLFLIGTIYQKEGHWLLTQYLAERTAEEADLLQAFLQDAASFSSLIHFNGTTFDLPYINARAKALRLPALSGQASVDLYQRLRPLKKLTGTAHMKQTDLEAFAGWARTDTLTGKHMVAMFHAYEKSSDPELLRLMLLHNHDDLIGMTHLLPLAAYRMLADGQIARITDAFLTVPASEEHPEPKASATAAKLCSAASLQQSHPADILSESTAQKQCLPNKNLLTGPQKTAGPEDATPQLQIQFTLTAPLPSELALSIPCSVSEPEQNFFQLFVKNTTAILKIPGISTELKYFFPDYKNYYYLPLEDQAIHKSVAAYVEKEYRVPAKAATCYTRKSGFFYPQPSAILAPAFRFSYESPGSYFTWQEAYQANPELLRPLLLSILARILP